MVYISSWNGGSRTLRGTQVVLHAGGALADAAALNQTAGTFRAAAAAKAGAASRMAIQTWPLPVAARVFFSSIAALLGAPGQANCTFPLI